jgi:inner membrane protein
VASVGHVFVGVAAARLRRKQARARDAASAVGAAVFWSALSLLPDADVIGFSFGVRYADDWGHRGATHSFVFAGAVALAVWGVAKWARLAGAGWTALTALAVVASHPLLDTLTDGGLGCALLWPFSTARFFAPWTPLPVAPIGRAFLTAAGARVAAVETIALLPLLLYAFWPRRRDVSAAGPPPR